MKTLFYTIDPAADRDIHAHNKVFTRKLYFTHDTIFCLIHNNLSLTGNPYILKWEAIKRNKPKMRNCLVWLFLFDHYQFSHATQLRNYSDHWEITRRQTGNRKNFIEIQGSIFVDYWENKLKPNLNSYIIKFSLENFISSTREVYGLYLSVGWRIKFSNENFIFSYARETVAPVNKVF